MVAAPDFSGVLNPHTHISLNKVRQGDFKGDFEGDLSNSLELDTKLEGHDKSHPPD